MTHPQERSDRPRDLPAWPVFILFAGFPIWWVLGLGAFAVAVCAVPMIVLLAQRRYIQIPPAFALWLIFLAWTIGSASQLDSKQLVGFAVRFGNLAGCAVLFLYLFNARRNLDQRRVLVALSLFFAFVIFGGYLGVVLPNGSITTVIERVLPGSITSNSYVEALVHPSFAEVQTPYGSPVSFARPSAPFPYTNSWGCNVALLVPLGVAALSRFRTRRARIALTMVLVLGVVPAYTTLNRGMYIGFAVAAVYVAIRLAARGRIGPLAGLIGLAIAGYAIAYGAGFIAKLDQRLQYSESNVGRSTIYRESFEGALQSPIFGFGAPRASDTIGIAVGSQGQVWNLMFSYGFIALALFVAWFVVAWWAGRAARGPGDLWVNASLVVGIVSFVYYGFDGPQLAVVMTAAALQLREREQFSRHSPRSAARTAFGL